MLAAAWKMVAEALKELDGYGTPDSQIRRKLSLDAEFRERYLVLYDIVNVLVEAGHAHFQVLVTTTSKFCSSPLLAPSVTLPQSIMPTTSRSCKAAIPQIQTCNFSSSDSRTSTSPFSTPLSSSSACLIRQRQSASSSKYFTRRWTKPPARRGAFRKGCGTRWGTFR